jgi:hypothetical protein
MRGAAAEHPEYRSEYAPHSADLAVVAISRRRDSVVVAEQFVRAVDQIDFQNLTCLSLILLSVQPPRHEHRVHPEDEGAMGKEWNQFLCLIVKPFLIPEEEKDNHH